MNVLVKLSRYYGALPEFVLAGGGNTSMKDGNRMWVKGSGQALADATEAGFVEMDRDQLDALLAAELSTDRDTREAQFKDKIYAARVHPELGQRPSVEVVVHHATPGRYVVHTHATLANMLTCTRGGERLCSELFGDAVVWIPYVDPGYVLARTIADALKAHKTRTGKASPDAILMQNHGLIVSGDSADEIRSRTDALMSKLTSRIAQGHAAFGEQTKLADSAGLPKRIGPMLRGLLAEVVEDSAVTLPLIAFDDSEAALAVACGSAGRDIALAGPSIPDQIVYAGVGPAWVEVDAAEDDAALLARLKAGVEKHRAEQRETPKVVVVQGVGIFYSGVDPKGLNTTGAVYRDAIAIMAGSASLSGFAPMTEDQKRFIQDWEVEAYRKGIAAKSAKGRVQNKVCLVTGAAQGFGLEISQGLAGEGAVVVLADINAEGVATAAQGISDQYGAGRAFGVTMNVTDEVSVATAVEEAVKTYGGVDLLVANAGVVRSGSVKSIAVNDFDFVTSVNYTGYFVCVQNASPVMAAQHAACNAYRSDIVQINSKSGLVGSNRNGAYAGSKFGGIGLTQSFALELVEDGIKVNSICPGNFFDGPLWSDPEKGLFVQYLRSGKVPGAQTVADVKASYESKVPMRRGCTTIDVLRAIFYLMEQQYETGQALPVTGGQVMLS